MRPCRFNYLMHHDLAYKPKDQRKLQNIESWQEKTQLTQVPQRCGENSM